MSRLVMQQFAPVDVHVGLHWAAFDENVLPPILDLPEIDVTATADHILVYLPFEDQNVTTAWLQGFSDQSFIQYSPEVSDGVQGNVVRRKANIHGFKRDLAAAKGVICNTGFELSPSVCSGRSPFSPAH